MTEYRTVYATFRDKPQALEIAGKLVAEKLVACVNIIPEITSLYAWQGKTVQDTECAFFAKTSAERAQDVVERIAQLHSYETPCIVVLPLESGHQPYLDWIAQSVKA